MSDRLWSWVSSFLQTPNQTFYYEFAFLSAACSWNEILQTREDTFFFNLKVSPKIGCLKDSIVEDFYKTLRILCKSWKTNHLPQMLTTKEAILVNLCKLLPKESN